MINYSHSSVDTVLIFVCHFHRPLGHVLSLSTEARTEVTTDNGTTDVTWLRGL